MKPSDVIRFLTQNVEPLSHPIYGDQYRAAVRLTDGTYLPCVLFRSARAEVELAVRRFKEVRWKRSEYKKTVKIFVTGGSRVAGYDISTIEVSPFAWPISLLKTIRGETTMGWTAFVVEMDDGTMHSFGTAFRMEFFDLPEGYTYRNIS